MKIARFLCRKSRAASPTSGRPMQEAPFVPYRGEINGGGEMALGGNIGCDPVLIQRRPDSAIAERCRSGRTGRSRKPLSLLRGTEGSNPSLSANESVAAARVPGRRRGATPPSSHSQISDTTPEQVI